MLLMTDNVPAEQILSDCAQDFVHPLSSPKIGFSRAVTLSSNPVFLSEHERP